MYIQIRLHEKMETDFFIFWSRDGVYPADSLRYIASLKMKKRCRSDTQGDSVRDPGLTYAAPLALFGLCVYYAIGTLHFVFFMLHAACLMPFLSFPESHISTYAPLPAR